MLIIRIDINSIRPPVTVASPAITARIALILAPASIIDTLVVDIVTRAAPLSTEKTLTALTKLIMSVHSNGLGLWQAITDCIVS